MSFERFDLVFHLAKSETSVTKALHHVSIVDGIIWSFEAFEGTESSGGFTYSLAQ